MPAKPIADSLPSNPSDLIELAVWCLGEVEQDARYLIDMAYWHCPYLDKGSERFVACRVGLGGALIAKQLNAPPEQYVGITSFKKSLDCKLVMLSQIGGGFIQEAIYFWPGRFDDRVKLSPEHQQFKIVMYKSDPDLFKGQLCGVASLLRNEYGL